jgi:hypothetical protein
LAAQFLIMPLAAAFQYRRAISQQQIIRMSQRKYVFAFWLAVLILFSSVTARAAEPRPIDGFSDHSFLLEEAYNQERGEVQHTLRAVYSRDLRLRGWSFNFEQESWLFTENHQVAFNIPFYHLREDGEKQWGVGDIQIEYRYQLTDERPNVPAVAPGFGLILPTGNRDKGTGNGVVGYEWSVAASKKVASRLALHANLGLTYLPKVRVPLMIISGFRPSALWSLTTLGQARSLLFHRTFICCWNG